MYMMLYLSDTPDHIISPFALYAWVLSRVYSCSHLAHWETLASVFACLYQVIAQVPVCNISHQARETLDFSLSDVHRTVLSLSIISASSYGNSCQPSPLVHLQDSHWSGRRDQLHQLQWLLRGEGSLLRSGWASSDKENYCFSKGD